MVFKMTQLIKNATIENLEKAMNEIDKLHKLEKRYILELKQWLDDECVERNETRVHYGI